MRTVARSGWPELAHKLAPRPYVPSISGTHSYHGDDVHFECEVTHAGSTASQLCGSPLLVPAAIRDSHQRKKIPGSRRFFLRDRESQRSLLGNGTPPHLRRISWLSLHTSQIGWLTAYNSTRAEAPTEPSAQIALPGKREDLRLGRGVIV